MLTDAGILLFSLIDCGSIAGPRFGTELAVNYLPSLSWVKWNSCVDFLAKKKRPEGRLSVKFVSRDHLEADWLGVSPQLQTACDRYTASLAHP